jgi:hypothetical protein
MIVCVSVFATRRAGTALGLTTSGDAQFAIEDTVSACLQELCRG